MSNLLMRDAAPLTAGEWEHVDGTVTNVARQYLVARQFIELVGPLGAGTEVVPVGAGAERRFIGLEVISADFSLAWRDLLASREAHMPLETGPVAMAAAKCAKTEDKMIFDALFKAAKKTVTLGDWNAGESPLSAVSAASEALIADDFYGPFAVVLSPSLYAMTERVSHGMGRTVGKLIKEVAEGGLFRSPLLGKDQGLVISLGAFNFDLIIGQDLVAAYAGNDGLDQCFKVMETLALRIKRAGAICKFAK